MAEGHSDPILMALTAVPDASRARIDEVANRMRELHNERKRVREVQKQEDRKRQRILDRLRGVSDGDVLGILAARLAGPKGEAKAKAKVKAASAKPKAKAKAQATPAAGVGEEGAADALDLFEGFDGEDGEAALDLFFGDDDAPPDEGAGEGNQPGVYAAMYDEEADVFPEEEATGDAVTVGAGEAGADEEQQGDLDDEGDELAAAAARAGVEDDEERLPLFG